MAQQTCIIEDEIKCRHLVLLVSKPMLEAHFEITSDFLRRGVQGVRGGGSGPSANQPRLYKIETFVNESVADEYLRRMREASETP